jgi:hypothetical protein
MSGTAAINIIMATILGSMSATLFFAMSNRSLTS